MTGCQPEYLAELNGITCKWVWMGMVSNAVMVGNGLLQGSSWKIRFAVSWKARNLLPLQKELAVIVIFPWSKLGEYSNYSTTRKVICLVPIIRILSILSLISGFVFHQKPWWFVATSIWRKFQAVFNCSRLQGFFPVFRMRKRCVWLEGSEATKRSISSTGMNLIPFSRGHWTFERITNHVPKRRRSWTPQNDLMWVDLPVKKWDAANTTMNFSVDLLDWWHHWIHETNIFYLPEVFCMFSSSL